MIRGLIYVCKNHSMDKDYQSEITFEGNDFNKEPLRLGEYEDCTFRNCNFAEQDLSGFQFSQCKFIDSDLSNIKTLDTAWQQVAFQGCKIIGIHFDTCKDFLFEISCKNCQLNYSSFYQKVLKGIKFNECVLIETDFTECDLSNGVFDECDLTGTIFENTNLEYADFSTAFNFIINPELNNIRSAKFPLAGLPGLLVKYRLEVV